MKRLKVFITAIPNEKTPVNIEQIITMPSMCSEEEKPRYALGEIKHLKYWTTDDGYHLNTEFILKFKINKIEEI